MIRSGPLSPSPASRFSSVSRYLDTSGITYAFADTVHMRANSPSSGETSLESDTVSPGAS